MLLREVMTEDPIAIRADRTIGDALAALDSAPIRHLPVLDAGALVGMLSDRSLQPWRQALTQTERWDEAGLRKLLLQEPLKEHFEARILFLSPDSDVREAIDLMLEFRVGALPVVDDDGGLVGIVSYVDLLRQLRQLLGAGH